MLERSECSATVVQPDAMGKPRPRKGLRFLDVVEKLDKLIGARADVLDLRRLFDRVELVADMVDAATRRRNDIVEAAEVAHEERFGGSAIGVKSAICHGLPTTGLIPGIDDLVPEALQQLCRPRGQKHRCSKERKARCAYIAPQ